jgi:hypothetical protein
MPGCRSRRADPGDELTTNHYLRVSATALTVTGIVALAHDLLRRRGTLPDFLRNDTLSPRAELIVSIVLVVVGLLLVFIAFSDD